MSSEQPMVRLIAGMPRSGTTWLATALNNHPDAAAFGEMAYWGRLWVQPAEDGLYHREQLDEVLAIHRQRALLCQAATSEGEVDVIPADRWPVLMQELFDGFKPPVSPGEVFLQFIHLVAREMGKTIAIEKTPHHVNWLDRVFHYLPNARLVVLVRDPYTFALSYKHQGDRKPEPNRRKFERLFHPLAVALSWRKLADSAQLATQKYGERVCVIRNSEMRARPEQTIRQVLDFFDIPPADAEQLVGVANTSFPAGKKPELDAATTFWINRVNRKRIAEWGFAYQPAEFAPLAIGMSMLRLPIWFYRNVRNTRVGGGGSRFGYMLSWLRPAK